MSGGSSEKTAWRIIALLSVIAAGAAIGDEGAHRYPGALYFWDVASYVTALDSPNPYRSDAVFPFLYPPVAADIFKIARSHLFELMAIAYAGAIAFFVSVYMRVDMPRKFEWLFAITAMGGMGVVSLKSGNVAIIMNFTLLALILDAAMGGAGALLLVPIAIGLGALIKPQFILYLGVLFVLERSRRTASVKVIATAVMVIVVHASYMILKPVVWSNYVAGVTNRTMSEQDFGWGATELFMHLTGSTMAALMGYAVSLLAVGGLCYWTFRKSSRAPVVGVACLAFIVLTFANPRVPLYDLYAAGIAVIICAAFAAATETVWVMAGALAINLVPWMISEFTRSPDAWPWWARDYMITHMAGVAMLLLSLSRTGLGAIQPEGKQVTGIS